MTIAKTDLSFNPLERLIGVVAGLCTIAWFLGSVPSLRFGWLRSFVPFGYVALTAWLLLFVLDYFKVRRNLINTMVRLTEEENRRVAETKTRITAIESLYKEFYAFQRRITEKDPISSSASQSESSG